MALTVVVVITAAAADVCVFLRLYYIDVEGKRSSGLIAVWLARNRFAVLDKAHQVSDYTFFHFGNFLEKLMLYTNCGFEQKERIIASALQEASK